MNYITNLAEGSGLTIGIVGLTIYFSVLFYLSCSLYSSFFFYYCIYSSKSSPSIGSYTLGTIFKVLLLFEAKLDAIFSMGLLSSRTPPAANPAELFPRLW
jgi:hypothetical protein